MNRYNPFIWTLSPSLSDNLSSGSMVINTSKDETAADENKPFQTIGEQGFEPWVELTPHNGFRDRPVQPLRHSSVM